MKNKEAFIESMRGALDLLRQAVEETPTISPKMVDAMFMFEHAMQNLADKKPRAS
jgi:hypothetical protein